MSTIITDIGKKKITEALAKGTMIKLKYIAVGDGNGREIIPDPSMTGLVNERYRDVITKYDVEEERPNVLTLYLTIPSTTGGFTIRELGVFDTNSNLIAIGNTKETVKPLPSESHINLTVRCVLTVSSGEEGVISVNCDPNFTLMQETSQEISERCIKVHNEDTFAHIDLINYKIKEHNDDPHAHEKCIGELVEKYLDEHYDLIKKYLCSHCTCHKVCDVIPKNIPDIYDNDSDEELEKETLKNVEQINENNYKTKRNLFSNVVL